MSGRDVTASPAPMNAQPRLGRISDQIAHRLQTAIEAGQYQRGDRLPALTRLATEFGVSVPTLRAALTRLETIGLVQLEHGRGTFVRGPQLRWEAKFRSFSETVRESGAVPGARLLDADTRVSNARVAAQLGLQEGAPVHYLRRLRLADDAPLAVEESYLPAQRLPDLLELYRDPMSLYDLLERSYGLHLVAGQHTVEAALIGQDDAEVLQVAIGSAALRVETLAYDSAHTPIECGYSVFPGDRYRYVTRLTR
jgi:GntR family transcriptional regulator